MGTCLSVKDQTEKIISNAGITTPAQDLKNRIRLAKLIDRISNTKGERDFLLCFNTNFDYIPRIQKRIDGWKKETRSPIIENRDAFTLNLEIASAHNGIHFYFPRCVERVRSYSFHKDFANSLLLSSLMDAIEQWKISVRDYIKIEEKKWKN